MKDENPMLRWKGGVMNKVMKGKCSHIYRARVENKLDGFN